MPRHRKPSKHWAREYTRSDGSQIHMEMIRLGIMSAADMAIFPLQDFMGLETEHRMNLPGTTVDNWIWRYTDGMLARVDAAYLRHMVGISIGIPGLGKPIPILWSFETEQGGKLAFRNSANIRIFGF